jgi:hypothetical protein
MESLSITGRYGATAFFRKNLNSRHGNCLGRP